MNKIEDAKKYVIDNVITPALASNLPDEYKNKARYARVWVNKFERVGDLIDYLSRFKLENNDIVYKTFKQFHLNTFEDIATDITQKFGLWASDRSNAEHFIVGNTYSSHQILIFARNYDTRSGGMFILGNNEAMVIKATLQGGQYPNEWIVPNQTLKYYLKSIKNVYSEMYKENAAVINTPDMPIYTFLRARQGDEFVYKGAFFFNSIHQELGGAKWFALDKSAKPTSEIYNHEYLIDDFDSKVKLSIKDSHAARKSRLEYAPKLPTRVITTTTAFKRNPDVVAEVLYRAKGICECCLQLAPFYRKSDDSPYLEVHHKVHLANDGEDTVDNSIALCPNCHRKFHFG